MYEEENYKNWHIAKVCKCEYPMAKQLGGQDFHFPPPPLVVKLIGPPLLVLLET